MCRTYRVTAHFTLIFTDCQLLMQSVLWSCPAI
nr:MAG TPA: hypothetical protein [Bacteriophage sp.]